MEAHNGLSARIVQEAGFQGIWASGLALSSQFGVRDSNEASWTQVVDMVEFMADATEIPILLDGDTGYGNFNNLRRLVAKLEQRQVAGVCIEDKLFPKTNSFLNGSRQPLAEVDEFCGKIRAGKEAQSDPDFCLVARVEALIAGWGMEEALRRAEAYRKAGADAILIHSRSSQPDEVLTFAKQWKNRLPLVVVPTKYYSTPTALFREAGISVVIWANHILRASIAAMKKTATEIYQTESLVTVEDRIAPLDEVFRLQGVGELASAEARYRPQRTSCSVVILAATRGEGLECLTEEKPKGMLTVAGRPLLGRLVDGLRSHDLHDINVVVGYRSESVELPGVTLRDNPRHQQSGELASLDCARDKLGSDTLILYGDLLFRSYLLRDLLEQTHEITILVDSAPGAPRDLVYCSRPDDRAVFDRAVTLLQVSQNSETLPRIDGRFVGMILARGDGPKWIVEALKVLSTRADFDALGLPNLLNHLVEQNHPVYVHYIHGHWLDVNTLTDLERAQSFELGWQAEVVAKSDASA